LVQCSTAGTKTTLLLLKLRFDYRPDSPLQYPGVDLTREAQECDLAVVGTHPLVPFLVNMDHHASLPVQRHCPKLPRNVEEATTAPQHPETYAPQPLACFSWRVPAPLGFALLGTVPVVFPLTH
ncbi:hypothetical protein CHARACLAT_032268, partial [Characodon lateralis]|nr:hypothetical protein [Characodon lateralis]